MCFSATSRFMGKMTKVITDEMQQACHANVSLCDGGHLCLRFSLFLLLDEKEPKNQGQNEWSAARQPKRLTFRSGSDFCEVKRQAPLRESQAFSLPLQAPLRVLAASPRPARSSVGVPAHGRFSRHVMPTLVCAMAGIYACVFLFVLLDKNEPKNQGRHQRPAALGGRPSAMSARPAHPAR